MVWKAFCLLKSLKWFWKLYSLFITNLILLAGFIVKSTDSIARLYYNTDNIAIIANIISWKCCTSDDIVSFCILVGVCMYIRFRLCSHVRFSACAHRYCISMFNVTARINMKLAECPLFLSSGKKEKLSTWYISKYWLNLMKIYKKIKVLLSLYDGFQESKKIVLETFILLFKFTSTKIKIKQI